ncbi:MAG: SatD family protein [Spirochaetales bacterium]|nr:SatD family protein [Spirochaetales bacterium]
MKAVITGDIINSREVNPEVWIPRLKEALSDYGQEPRDWEIYRGDSFQTSVKASDALQAALLIKAAIKMEKKLDVRMAIGLGDIDFDTNKITEANGKAFINSGEKFENLKKNTLAIKSSNPEFDQCMNVILDFAMLIANAWKPITAEVIQYAFKNPGLNQSQLASALHKKSQSTISEALARGGYEELLNLLDLYQKKLTTL